MKKKLLKVKVLIAAFIGLFLGVIAPLVSPITSASGHTAFESTLKVANVTAGDTTYHPSINAKIDDVVKVELYYHNKEAENSGILAKGVNVKISIPGTDTKAHTISSTVSGSNIDTFNRTTTVNTSVNTKLNYIPGSAFRRHNKGTNANPNWVTEKISDSIVSSGVSIGDMKSCFNFQETITVLARVNAPVVSIVKKVKIAGTSEFKPEITAKPGDKIEYSIGFKNEGNVTLNDVVIRDSFPPNLIYEKGSAVLINSLHPNGMTINDNIINSGVIVGNYKPGINGIVRLKATVPKDIEECHKYTNIGVVKSKELGEYYNTAIVNACGVKPPEVKKNRIKAIKFEDKNGNGKKDSGEQQLSDWKMTLTGEGMNKSQVTGSTGETVFTDVSTGKFTVTETLKEDWTNVTPLSQTIEIPKDKQDCEFTIFFANKKKEVKPPEVKKNRIKVIKFEDTDGDKVKDGDEKLLPDWQMTVTGPDMNKTQNTDANGETIFNEVGIGKFNVTETLKEGWINVTPLSQSVEFKSGEQNCERVVMFANKKKEVTPPVTPPAIGGGQEQLPVTGPEQAAMGTFGTLSLFGAAAYMRNGKKKLLDSIKKIK